MNFKEESNASESYAKLSEIHLKISYDNISCTEMHAKPAYWEGSIESPAIKLNEAYLSNSCDRISCTEAHAEPIYRKS